jgi:hypothetical protein
MVRKGSAMAGTRKIAAILVADIFGCSRLASADEDRTRCGFGGHGVIITIGMYRCAVLTFSDNPVYLAGCERILEGLRKVGLPEG